MEHGLRVALAPQADIYTVYSYFLQAERCQKLDYRNTWKLRAARNGRHVVRPAADMLYMVSWLRAEMF